MQKNVLKYKFILLLLYSLFLVQCKKDKDPQYFVFSASYFPVSETVNTNVAIVITDQDSIKYFMNLFHDNDLEKFCPCGYNYRIELLTNKGISIENHLYHPDNVYINNNERINKEIEILISRMYNHPSHYIYNIEIKGDSRSAMTKMKNNGFLVFMMDNNSNSYLSTIQVLYNNDFDSLKKELSQFSFIQRVEKALNSLNINE